MKYMNIYFYLYFIIVYILYNNAGMRTIPNT